MNRRRPRRRISDERRRNRRAVIMGVFFCLCLGGLLYQVWYYQTVWGEEYSILVVTQEARRQIARASREIAPSRGVILDRNMQPITGSHQVFTVFLDVYELHNRQRRNANPERNFIDEALAGITEALGIPRRDLAPLFQTDAEGSLLNRTRHHVLRRQVPPEIALPLTEAHADIHADEESLRWHHDPFFAPQVIGFIRGPYMWGLESSYNRQLEGESGRVFWVQGDTEEIAVRDGFTLVTTLDGDIQRLAQEYVNRTILQHPSAFVAMIIMDPRTGEILAMAQAPTFSMAEPMNPEFITDHALLEQWPYLTEGERVYNMNRLWRNYHTTRSSEPGSVFKPFVIAAAYEEGVISRQDGFHCIGFRDILDQRIFCHSRYGCGPLSLSRALYRSCNVAMTYINEMLGRDTFYRYRGYFGFGEFTGIDLPGEIDVSQPGVMYTRARLNPVEMGTSSIGQGFNATTIQTITGYAALINGGNMMRPFIVSQIVDSHGNVVQENLPTVTRRAISESTSDFIRREMQSVVEPDGTGHRSAIQGHAIGGKTGTAQQGRREDENNTLTYVAFTPVENPEFLVLMTIDHIEETGQHVSAGRFVAPIVRDFLIDLIELRNLPPSDGPYAMDLDYWRAAVMGTPLMPDFRGQRLADVVRNLNNTGNAGYHVVGSGRIIYRHIPAPGQPMPQNSPIFFHMDSATRAEELMTIVPDVYGLTVAQAEIFTRDAGLPAVFFTSAGAAPADISYAATAGAVPIPQDDDSEPPPPVPYRVYQQFPAAGAEVERGTQVKIRAR